MDGHNFMSEYRCYETENVTQFQFRVPLPQQRHRIIFFKASLMVYYAMFVLLKRIFSLQEISLVLDTG